ncbi:quinolinate synthetase A (partial) [Erwinia amylovora MR1]|nr:quinolinate synthetase A (partial) [Erwinia amylovora MR1]
MDGNERSESNCRRAVAEGRGREILVDDALREGALIPLHRMLTFAAVLKLKVKGNA